MDILGCTHTAQGVSETMLIIGRFQFEEEGFDKHVIF